MSPRDLFAALGVGEGQALFEDKSRNTHENAVFTKPLGSRNRAKCGCW